MSELLVWIGWAATVGSALLNVYQYVSYLLDKKAAEVNRLHLEGLRGTINQLRSMAVEADQRGMAAKPDGAQQFISAVGHMTMGMERQIAAFLTPPGAPQLPPASTRDPQLPPPSPE